MKALINKIFNIKQTRGILAWLMGYFWLPCPLCGEMMAGFEVHGSLLHYESGNGVCVCWRCQEYCYEVNEWINNGKHQFISII